MGCNESDNLRKKSSPHAPTSWSPHPFFIASPATAHRPLSLASTTSQQLPHHGAAMGQASSQCPISHPSHSTPSPTAFPCSGVPRSWAATSQTTCQQHRSSTPACSVRTSSSSRCEGVGGKEAFDDQRGDVGGTDVQCGHPCPTGAKGVGTKGVQCADIFSLEVWRVWGLVGWARARSTYLFRFFFSPN